MATAKDTQQMSAAASAALRHHSEVASGRGPLHEATTSPSVDVPPPPDSVPGRALAEAFGQRVAAAGGGRVVDPQLAVVVSEVQRMICGQAQVEVEAAARDRALHEHLDVVQRELGAFRKTLDDTGDLAFEAAEKSRRASAIAEVTSQRLGAVEERGSSPAMPVQALLAETINEQRPGSQRPARVPVPTPASMVAPRPLATEESVVAVEQRLDRIERMLVVAARGDRAQAARLDEHDTGFAWVRKRLGWFALVTAVAVYCAQLTYQWAVHRPPPPPAVLEKTR